MATTDKIPAAAGDEVMVSLYEAHKKVYPRSVTGVFAKWRWFFVIATQLFFYGMPWLQWGGRQAMLFDLETRRFYIFGLVLYPQDVIYLAAILIISAMLLFLFTAVAGRQWCGYACPQTVYTEIYLWIERKFEGDRSARLRLDAAPMSANKLWRKVGKQAAWIAVGLWTGFTFVGYFTPIRELAGHVVNLNLGPWETFWICFYGFATYGNGGYMREQVCKYMCPYARFQSAMFDKDTLIVTYDAKRGEPRGARSKKADHHALGLGDCVNCTLCVQVCPTGIDIRNGLQYDCISCAACIDVCDDVMDKVGYPRGLIRYSTERALEEGWGRSEILRRVLRPRVLIYSAILAAVTIALIASLFLRTPFKVDIVRDRATLARMVEGGKIENVYRVQIMNATEKPQQYSLSVDGLPGIQLVTEPRVTIEGAQSLWVPVRLQIPYDAAKPGSHEIHIGVRADDGEVREKSVFMVPR
ncbi:cytochrome c oxidase accessory protein CcoG [Ottowia sp. GY511]|uniref:Cytochrome c oxidase accessory protein CcoG n=1 Tax=Ottowia flava TaxID=2675430 RepID=A0ABW4KRB9_9BURK|nr:cytochrome c oxidase accessory protein CcoG [Ottowia sp. GY511]TXK22470.1 cytochrome c oxidase accessory protein CcoG [Ottowia sp. GY511]